MKKEAIYRGLTIMMPLAGVLCASGVSIFEWQRLKRLEGETLSTQEKLRHIDQELRSYEAQPTTEKFPTVARTPREQALFLDALRANADVCKVQLVRWSNTTPAPAAPTGDKGASPLPPAVSSIVSIVEVAGRSENTRQFLYNVLRSRRLLNMSDLKWVRDTWPNTHLTFTLTRYVAPPVQLPGGHSPAPHAQEAGSHAAPASPSVAGTRAPQTTVEPVRAALPGGMALPNPMDAPGLSHGYRSQLEAGVSQLSELDRGRTSASPHPPAVTDAKH